MQSGAYKHLYLNPSTLGPYAYKLPFVRIVCFFRFLRGLSGILPACESLAGALKTWNLSTLSILSPVS